VGLLLLLLLLAQDTEQRLHVHRLFLLLLDLHSLG
jgi:hypothetical protein